MGMPDHDRVRDYILAQLTALGLRPQMQTTTGVGTRYQVAGRVQNILAWLPGADAHGKAVLLVAHYDGVEAGPAAGDDGAGAAALLETIRALRAATHAARARRDRACSPTARRRACSAPRRSCASIRGQGRRGRAQLRRAGNGRPGRACSRPEQGIATR